MVKRLVSWEKERMAEPDVVPALVALGFSLNESRAYAALLQDSPATGYEVGVRAQIPRSAVYGVLRRLVKAGAARSIAGTPERFAPAAAEDLLVLLRKRFDSSTEQLETAIRSIDTSPPAPGRVQRPRLSAHPRGGRAPHPRRAAAPRAERLAARDRADLRGAEARREAEGLHRRLLARRAAAAAGRGLQLRARGKGRSRSSGSTGSSSSPTTSVRSSAPPRWAISTPP